VAAKLVRFAVISLINVICGVMRKLLPHAATVLPLRMAREILKPKLPLRLPPANGSGTCCEIRSSTLL
jgi:hypothetical protein